MSTLSSDRVTGGSVSDEISAASADCPGSAANAGKPHVQAASARVTEPRARDRRGRRSISSTWRGTRGRDVRDVPFARPLIKVAFTSVIGKAPYVIQRGLLANCLGCEPLQAIRHPTVAGSSARWILQEDFVHAWDDATRPFLCIYNPLNSQGRSLRICQIPNSRNACAVRNGDRCHQDARQHRPLLLRRSPLDPGHCRLPLVTP